MGKKTKKEKKRDLSKITFQRVTKWGPEIQHFGKGHYLKKKGQGKGCGLGLQKGEEETCGNTNRILTEEIHQRGPGEKRIKGGGEKKEVDRWPFVGDERNAALCTHRGKKKNFSWNREKENT